MEKDKKNVKEAVLEHVAAISKNELTCAKAMELAKNNGLDLKEIRIFCNENKIKLVDCQLGCF